MGNIASGHFKPTNNIQEKHNDRTLSPSYLIPKEFRGQNEVNRTSDQAIELKERIIENAISIYEQTKKKNAPKFKAKSYLWSLVVNIKTNTTMSDLEKLAEHFDLKYGFQCYQIAIHRDEGYIDPETNQPHTNHHAHMEFVTLNKKNGKNMMRKAHLSPKKFADMQTEIAQILGMERGKSGTKRIEPRKYAQMKNKERKALNTLKQKKDKEINTLKQEKTTLESKLQEKDKTINEQAQTIQAKEKEIATAIDTANIDFPKKIPTLQEAVRRIHQQAEMLSAIYNLLNQTAPNYVSKLTEKYKQVEFFTKPFDAIKKLKELYSKIVEKLFGDKNAKKDNQDILNAITELQERPTKQQLEAKEQEINTLKQEKTTLTNKLQEQATETQKAQDRIKTLESNENTLKNDLNAKESIIQAKDKELNTLKQERTDLKDKLQKQDKTINELKKQIQELEYNYHQERERMKAENKRLQEQGLDKIYTQKDYENLKAEHNEQIEALKKKLKEQDKTIKKNNTYRRNAENAKNKQIQQRRKMMPPLRPTPQPTYTPTKRI